MSAEITVEFEVATGTPTVSVKGVPGPACRNATKDIELALGKVSSVVKTADYSKAEQTKNSAQAKG